MKKIMKEAHRMTKEIVKNYEVEYRTQFRLCLAYLLNKKEEETMIKLYNVEGDLFFADVENDKIYEIGVMNDLVAQNGVIDDYFDIEDAEEVKVEDHYKVKYIVDEKDTYSIKEIIKEEGGKWDSVRSRWIVKGPSRNFKTKILLSEK